jgi:uncharacterized protein (TIRG00374 family)
MKKNMKRWILAAILAAMLLFALSRLDGQSLLYSIGQIPLWLVVALPALQIITQLLVNLQWHKIARLADIPISFWDMLYANCQGAVMDSVTPGVKIGGEVTRAVQISRIANCPGNVSAAVVAVQKLFSLSAFFIILLFAAGRFFALPFLLAFFYVFARPDRIISRLQAKKAPRFAWVRKIRDFLMVALGQIGHVVKNKRALVMLSVLSLSIWLLYPAKMYILAVQFHPEAQILHIAAITFAAYMVAMLPIFPGGLGGFEATMAGLLAAVGVAVSDAAVITVFFRFATFWFVMPASLTFVALHKARKNRRHKQ